jgi:hypothetical protein
MNVYLCIIILEYLCLGGWESEIPYNTLPGVSSSSNTNGEMNEYSQGFYDNQIGNRRSNDYGNSNYNTDQDGEDSVI